MTEAFRGNRGYRAKWDYISRLVNFKVKFNRELSPAEKGKITRYWKAAVALKKRGTFEYRPRNKENLKTAQEYAQHPPGFSGFKVAFIPTTNGERQRVRIYGKGKSRHVVIADQGGAVSRVVWQFRAFEKYAGEAWDVANQGNERVAARILAKDKASKEFRRVCGEHEETAGAFTREFLAEKIAQFVSEYGNHRRWFTGVIGYRFAFQADIAEYYKARGIAGKAKRRKGQKKARGRKE